LGLTPNNPTPLGQSSHPGVASLAAATHWALGPAQPVVEPAVPAEADEPEAALAALGWAMVQESWDKTPEELSASNSVLRLSDGRLGETLVW